MSKKIDRAKHGPSWAEVILGAVLSLVLGVVIGAVLLILRPVEVAKEKPKEPNPKVVYYLEGARDSNKAKQALAKRKAFVEGQSVTVTEDEINSLITPTGAAPGAPATAEKGKDAKAKDPKAKAPEKSDKAAPAAAPASSGEAFAPGAPNFRLADGVMQVGVPVMVNALGLGQKVIVQARGGFVKQGDLFVYEPTDMYLGSCPVQRLPFLATYVRDKFIATQPIPEDIKASWSKLTNVAIEGNALKLTMP
jgi:hypothetical protein